MNEEQLTTEIATLHQSTLAIRVTDATTYKLAADWLQRAKGMQKTIKEWFAPLKEKAHAAHKALTTREGEELAKLAPVEAHLKKEINAYNAEQERIRQAEQARLDAIRAEEQRKLDEARAAEQRRLYAEVAAVRKIEEEKRAAELAAAKARNDAAEAARIAALPPPIVAVPQVAPPPVLQRTVVQSAAPKVAGVITKTVWLFDVTDALAVPREFLMVDEKKIREYVQALKESAKIPGVRIYSEQQVAASGR